MMTFRGSPTRYRIDIERQEVVDKTVLKSGLPDFPAIDCRRDSRSYEEFWALDMSSAGKVGQKFFDRLVYFNWESESETYYQSPKGRYLGAEPIVIAHGPTMESLCVFVPGNDGGPAQKRVCFVRRK